MPTSLTGEGVHSVLPAVTSVSEHDDSSPFRVTDTTRVVIENLRDEAELIDDAHLLAREILDLTEPVGTCVKAPDVIVGLQARPGDIILTLAPDIHSLTSPEGYLLVATAQNVRITSTTADGVFYGTRTFLQALSTSGGIQSCSVTDEPQKAVRGLHLDVARKYFSLPWLLRQVREMAWFKLNELQLHFSENEAFRLDLYRHPEIVSTCHLHQEEVRALLAEARLYHVRVVPALDVPGHMRHVLSTHPELRASSTEHGRCVLDYSLPASRSLVTDLLDEIVPLFGARTWHVGGDEVLPAAGTSWDQCTHDTLSRSYPNLAAYAQEHCGQGATVLDGYVYYLETVIEHLRALGVQEVRVWNDALALPGTTWHLDQEVVITYWTAWHPDFASVQHFVDRGHRIINFNDSAFYYVLSLPEGSYPVRPTAERIYAWRPGAFPALSTDQPQTWDADEPWDSGAFLSVWCDAPEEATEAKVAADIRPCLRALACRTWNPSDKASFTLWTIRSARL